MFLPCLSIWWKQYPCSQENFLKPNISWFQLTYLSGSRCCTTHFIRALGQWSTILPCFLMLGGAITIPGCYCISSPKVGERWCPLPHIGAIYIGFFTLTKWLWYIRTNRSTGDLEFVKACMICSQAHKITDQITRAFCSLLIWDGRLELLCACSICHSTISTLPLGGSMYNRATRQHGITW